MDNIIGKGVIYTGSGELALYDAWLTDNSAKPVGSVKAGDPVGVVMDEKPDTGDIQIRNNSGGFVYTVYDPDIMKVVDEDPGQAIQPDTSWFTSSQGTDSFTFVNILPPVPATITSKEALQTGNPGAKRVVDGIRKKKVPFVVVAGATGLLVIVIIVVVHVARKKAKAASV